MDESMKLKKGERAARLATLVTLLLSVTKGVAGWVSGSVALLADAVHSFSDIFASLAVFIGLRLARRKPDERFPYGYYKAETFASLAVSIVIILSGVEMFGESVESFFNPAAPSFPHLVLPLITVLTFVSYLLSKYEEKVGREINSQALIGEGKHSRIDAYLSLLVLAGIALSTLGLHWMESFAGLMISLFVIWIGLSMGKNAILVLMDACLEPELKDLIKEAAMGVRGVKGVHDLRLRRSGPFVFGEMHVEVEKGLSVDKAHKISTEIEQKVKEVVREVDTLTIHIEPKERDSFKVAIPAVEDKGLSSRTSPHFGRAPYFLLVDVRKGKVKGWEAKENPGAKLERKIGITAARFLVKKKVDVLLVGGIGEGPFHVLRDNFIELYKLPRRMSAREAIDKLLKGELEEVREPEKNRGF